MFYRKYATTFWLTFYETRRSLVHLTLRTKTDKCSLKNLSRKSVPVSHSLSQFSEIVQVSKLLVYSSGGIFIIYLRSNASWPTAPKLLQKWNSNFIFQIA